MSDVLINADSLNIETGTKSENGLVNSDAALNLLSATNIDISNCRLENEVFIVENAIPADVCNFIIETCSKNGRWSKSLTTGEIKGHVSSENSLRQSDSAGITGNPLLKEIDTFIHRSFVTGLDQYSNRIGADLCVYADEGYTLLRYGPNGRYHTHIDYSGDPQAPLLRAVSGLIYLNDDYEGGEIFFNRFNLKIKPKQGSIIYFPSTFTHPHASLPIKTGTKYCIVTWWR